MLTQNERNYLLNSMEDLLCEYDYDYNSYAVENIIDTWAEEKGELIEAFKKHPNYLEGKFMIAFDADYEREIDKKASDNFGSWIRSIAVAETMDMEHPKAIVENKEPWSGWLPYDVYAFFCNLKMFAERCVSETSVEYLKDIFTELHFHTGQKTSRVMNKICQYLGFDKVDGYNREFAKYADSLSPMVIKRHTILSINPLDYLTMSFGNSWASCHTIDKDNKRNMPNNYSGCYSSGTVSYMLDKTSMVLYTVDASYNGNEYWNEPKINRQMFHYGNEKLVQGRLYPQDNDGDDKAYVPYRNIVQQIISTIFDFPNLWVLKKGTSEVCRYVLSNGTNYPDYRHYNNCSISRIKGSENENDITIGARPICVSCGDRHTVEDNINCCGDSYVCEDCGCRVDREDAIWIGDEVYCRDCVNYCERCDEYYRQSETTYVNGYGYVCDECLSQDFIYCEECGEYVRDYDAYYIDNEDRHVCEYCYHEYYAECDKCGEIFRREDMYEHNGYMYCEDCHDAIEEDEEEVC